MTSPDAQTCAMLTAGTPEYARHILHSMRMEHSRRWPFIAFVLASLLALAPISRAATDSAATSAADLELQYQAAQAALKKPGATGVLVTEVSPESPAALGATAAGGGGLRAGDIIIEYYGTRITTLQSLREQVAEAVAQKIQNTATGARVLLRARRGSGTAGPGEEITLQLPREPLGIRAIEVEAGVPGPRNPPATPRGKLALNWRQALEALADHDSPHLFRTIERTPPAPGTKTSDDAWIGWQSCTFTPGQDALAGTIDTYRIDPADPDAIPDHSTITFRLQLGDFKSTPAFLLDAATARFLGSDNAQLATAATRVGDALRVDSSAVGGASPANGAEAAKDPRPSSAMPLNAIIQPALPAVAAALPHEKDAVLGLYLLSVRDFLPRPGYVLATRGKQPLPAPTTTTTAPANTKPIATETAWRVDLMHCGMVLESYWFTDACALVCTQAEGVRPVISRRVATIEEAGTAR